MISVLCPVCGALLAQEAHCWHCAQGHSFDVARQGYVNLLPVSQKHSRQPGDSRLQLTARRAFLGSGVYAPIADRLCAILARYAPASVLDVGCGEGYYLRQVQKALPETEVWGVDISKDGVRLAAGSDRRGHYLTATAAHLPFAGGSFDLLCSMFALTLPEEFARVLTPDGIFVQVTAGEDHLLALRSLIYAEVVRKEKPAAPALSGFSLLSEELLEFPFTLDSNEAVMQLLSMTPHAMRITKEGAARAEAAQRLSDRAQVCFRVYRRGADVL